MVLSGPVTQNFELNIYLQNSWTLLSWVQIEVKSFLWCRYQWPSLTFLLGSPKSYHYWGWTWPLTPCYSPRYSSYSGVDTLSYLAAVLQMSQAFVNKTHMVRALMKLNLVEKTGIEQIITIVISMSKGRYAAQLVRRAGRGFPKDCHRSWDLKDELDMVGREGG